MMENKSKKGKIIVGVMAALVIVAVIIIGLTYAFFSPVINQSDGTNIVIRSGSMKIDYASGGPDINIPYLNPSNEAQATMSFTVTGNSTINQSMEYYINLVVTKNEFPIGALSVTLTGTNTSGNGTIADSLEPQHGIPSGIGTYKLGKGTFSGIVADREHDYTFQLWFLPSGAMGEEFMDKNFSGRVHISPTPGTDLSQVSVCPDPIIAYGDLRANGFPCSTSNSTLIAQYINATDKDAWLAQNPNFVLQNADVNGDGVIDWLDRELIQLCGSGWKIPLGPPCEHHSPCSRNNTRVYIKDDLDLIAHHIKGTVTLSGAALKIYDFNDDGVVDEIDYLILQYHLYFKAGTHPHLSAYATLCHRDLVNGVWGDIDGDGILDTRDLAFISQYLAGWAYDGSGRLVPPTKKQLFFADVDGSGNIHGGWSALVEQYLAYWFWEQQWPRFPGLLP